MENAHSQHVCCVEGDYRSWGKKNLFFIMQFGVCFHQIVVYSGYWHGYLCVCVSTCMAVEHQIIQLCEESSSGSLILSNCQQKSAFTLDAFFPTTTLYFNYVKNHMKYTQLCIYIHLYMYILYIQLYAIQTSQKYPHLFDFTCSTCQFAATFCNSHIPVLPFAPLESPSGRCSCWGPGLWSTRSLPRCRGRKRHLPYHRINTAIGGRPKLCSNVLAPVDPSFTRTLWCNKKSFPNNL